jgi:hypothetical protein
MVGDEPNVATATAVTAVGATLGDVGLAAKRHTPCSPITGFGVELGRVNKARHTSSLLRTFR